MIGNMKQGNNPMESKDQVIIELVKRINNESKYLATLSDNTDMPVNLKAQLDLIHCLENALYWYNKTI